MTHETQWLKVVSGVESVVTIAAGDYAIAPDPLPTTDEGDTADVTSIDQATLDAGYTAL